MTTRTERRPLSPKRSTGAPNLRLYLIACLASVYVLAWWAFGARVPTRAAERSRVAPGPAPTVQRQVAMWYQDLLPAARPAVQVPVGWHIAERGAVSLADARAVTRPVRVSPSRPGRVRTRSS